MLTFGHILGSNSLYTARKFEIAFRLNHSKLLCSKSSLPFMIPMVNSRAKVDRFSPMVTPLQNDDAAKVKVVCTSDVSFSTADCISEQQSAVVLSFVMIAHVVSTFVHVLICIQLCT